MPDTELPPPFTCEVRPDRERVVLHLKGELDLAVVPELRHAVQQLLQVGFEVLVVDLRALTFIDSSGLRELLSASRAATAAGSRLCLIRGPDAVHRVFEITSATELFDFDGLSRRG